MKKGALLLLLAAVPIFAGKSGMAVKDGYYSGSLMKKTYYINYKRYFFIPEDKYYTYDKKDLAVDYKKQMAREKRMKDTL